ncbi:MAG TPA: hypothetical protein VLX68_12550 [Chitinivibrionales bacterium]|nr:hypothetical protein [Chitinivibrionales bacterium]
MNIVDNQELINLRDDAIDGMIGYLSFEDATYTRDDVEECKNILEEHLVMLSRARNNATATECVKETVQRLNDLNSKVGGELIQSDQRGEISEYMCKAGAMLGFNKEYEDVTEKWREW